MMDLIFVPMFEYIEPIPDTVPWFGMNGRHIENFYFLYSLDFIFNGSENFLNGIPTRFVSMKIGYHAIFNVVLMDAINSFS